ncbi:MAG: hypothetical protein EPN70_19460 [Paraburkholderia sp.]|uniref:hypothetical protein n=1 Tax=Paraburkholderia sp. TaxID=1926495 RepID=UPI0011FA6F64|nr:hypothetical protein [Paraburkholderia sp.]TAM01408.1 MAG: hypothetical protein EPN70_19460 [Paraburkholderia sp.]TAM30117.1 MAG: hypothetical protein EPN59_09650 [Paraburkholderia sp.]
MTQVQKSLASMPTSASIPTKSLADHVLNDLGPESDALRGARKRAATEIAQTMKTAFRANVKPAEGVVLVTCADPTILTVAAAAIADGILADDTIADQPVRAVSTLTFLHSSGSREAESMKSYTRSCNQADKMRAEAIEHCRRFNPLAPEGVPLLMDHVKPDACVFTTVAYRDLKRDEAIAAIAQLNAEAQRLGALIVLFIVHAKKQDVTGLRAYCNACMEVSTCEPGPGAQIAVLLDNVTLTNWHQQGIGRVMVEAFLESNGTWTFAQEQFIAARAIIRVAWYLRAKGATIEKIAEVIGINKSNVSRGLESSLIPPENTVGLVPPTGWAKRWASRYNFDGVLSRKSSIKSTDTSPEDETANDLVTTKADDGGANRLGHACS